MTAFLVTVMILFLSEVFATIFHALKGSVPVRTASGMAWNAAIMFALGLWAFWLLCRQ